jgi:hypothetical protein
VDEAAAVAACSEVAALIGEIRAAHAASRGTYCSVSRKGLQ